MFLLIVDDEAAIRDFVVEAAQIFFPDARIEACASGHEALGVCAVTRPSLVLTDLQMPGMSGEELAEEIRRLHPDCRVAMMTGMPPKGFVGLTKPFGLSQLAAFLRKQGLE